MPTKVLTDTTINSAAEVMNYWFEITILHDSSIEHQAMEQDLTTGINFPSGRGQRCLLLGAGGSDGWGMFAAIHPFKIPF